MTRKKVKLTWIANDNARKASMKKRRLGLLKKVSELTTLCGISAFIIVYSPDEVEPTVWPSRPVVQQLLARFHAMPEMERSKKMINQESYMKERLAKVHDLLKKNQRRNRESEGICLMYQIHSGRDLDNLSINELQALVWYMEEINKAILKKVEYVQQVPPLQHLGGEEMANVGPDDRGLNESLMWDQWFIDIMNSENRGQSSSTNRSDMGVPHHLSAGKSTIDDMVLPRHSFLGGSDVGMPSHGNFNAPSTEIQGLQPNIMGFKATESGISTEMGLQPFGNIGGSASSNFGTDVNMGLRLQQFHVNYGGGSSTTGNPVNYGGSSTTGNQFAGQPFGQFGEGGNSNTGTESDNPLQFDFSKTWPSP